MFIFRTTFTQEDVQRLETRLLMKHAPSPPISARTAHIIDTVEFSPDDVKKAVSAAATAMARE